MRFLNKTPNFDFMGKRRLAAGFSIALVLISLASLFIAKLNFGIDFTGGSLIEVGYDQPVDLADVRGVLGGSGYGDAVVQHFGTVRDVLIRIAPREGVSAQTLSDKIVESLRRGHDGALELRRVEFVGPQVGDELAEEGGLAMLIALGAILIYVALRFEYRFALGAVIALAHDVTITLGLFSVLQLDFDLTVLAALLAVIGYSLNDAIVVFDRVRENFRKIRKGDAVAIVNTSLNQTLSRTLMTSLTTLLVLFALFIFGGELIHGFATALIAGIVVGTYSSIYVASAMALALGVSRADLMPVAKEGAEVDSSP